MLNPAHRELRKRVQWLRVPVAGAVAVLALALGGCGGPNQPAASAIVGNSPAAVVNGEVIYADDVQIAAERLGYVEKGERLEVDSAEFDRVLARLIDVRLMAQAALGKSLDADRIARWDLQWMRDSKLANLLVDDSVAERVDEAEIRRVYDRQVEIFNQSGNLGDEFHVRRLVVATQADADAVARQLAGGTDFAVLATQKSIDQETKLDGGDLGWLNDERAGPELARQMRAVSAGSVSRPYQVQGGWAIIKVDERRREQAPSLEQMRPDILAYLRTVQTDRILRELYASARIERKTSPANAPLETDPFSLAPAEPPRSEAPAPAPNLSPPAPAPAASATPPPPVAAQTASPTPASPRPTPSASRSTVIRPTPAAPATITPASPRGGG
jgi:peptidyl-prolyl cis-trans isomerase C